MLAGEVNNTPIHIKGNADSKLPIWSTLLTTHCNTSEELFPLWVQYFTPYPAITEFL